MDEERKAYVPGRYRVGALARQLGHVPSFWNLSLSLWQDRVAAEQIPPGLPRGPRPARHQPEAPAGAVNASPGYLRLLVLCTDPLILAWGNPRFAERWGWALLGWG